MYNQRLKPAAIKQRHMDVFNHNSIQLNCALPPTEVFYVKIFIRSLIHTPRQFCIIFCSFTYKMHTNYDNGNKTHIKQNNDNKLNNNNKIIIIKL